MKTQKGYGLTATKVIKLLEKALDKYYPNIHIQPKHLWFNEGGNSHAYLDLARWGANLNYGIYYVQIYSWDKMSDCARGLSLIKPSRGSTGEFEVCADKIKD